MEHVIRFSKSFEEYVRHVQDLLPVLQVNGLSLKIRKRHFLKHSVDYLGHVIIRGTKRWRQRTW